jgi:hypothetical protein
VRFYIPGRDKTVFFAPDGITFVLRGKGAEGTDWAVKLAFVDANEDVVLRGAARRRAVFSYFSGPRPQWKTGLPSYGEVVYEGLWPGIDLAYRAGVGVLKYEFRVAPGADPKKIRLRYRGATAVETTETGGLRVETPVASFTDEPPIAWVTEDDHSRTPVEVAFQVAAGAEGASALGFDVGAYATDRPLVIDPAVFVYCGFIGGGGWDAPSGVTVDSKGFAYVGGVAQPSPTFPVKVGPSTALPPAGGGFVAKVAASGKELVYCGWIAGTRWAGDALSGIAVDPAGCAYVTGMTLNNESQFPVTVGPDLIYNSKSPLKPDCWVAKVNAAGTALDYCGYIGGHDHDWGLGIAVDAAGCAYVVGETVSADPSQAPPNAVPFPTRVGPDTTHNGGPDVFVAKVNAAGTGLDYCGYVGGTGADTARINTGAIGSIAVDSKGCAYIIGQTNSTEATFPVRVGPRLAMWPGAFLDGFVAKVNAAGTGLDYCGYFGGGHFGGPIYEGLYGVAVDAQGHAYLAGTTQAPASRLPLTVGPSLQRLSTNSEAIVAKLTPNGAGFVYCGVIGDGGAGSSAYGIAVDGQGNAFVTGTARTTFPAKGGPLLVPRGSWGAGLIAMIDRSGRSVRYAGFIGGAFPDIPAAVAVTPSGTAFVVGWAMSGEMSGFPVTVGPDLTHNQGGSDGFIAKIGFDDIVASGSTRIGGTVTFDIKATESPGLAYQLGSSLGEGPIRIGTRRIGLSPDPLFLTSASNVLPSIFYRYRGVIDPYGTAAAELRIPKIPALIGTRIHTAYVTLDPTAPYGIHAISDTAPFTITQ